METERAEQVDWELVRDRTLILQDDVCHYPDYTSIVLLSEDMLLVVDKDKNELRLHSCRDGHFLVKRKLQSQPYDVCLVDSNRTQVAVTLLKGQIEIMSVDSRGKSVAISQVRTLYMMGKFKYCQGVRALRSWKKLVVSGVKMDKENHGDWFCWGIVSVDRDDVIILEICTFSFGSTSYLATDANDTMVYISCWTGPHYPSNNGVYAFDLRETGVKFTYRPCELAMPHGICVDRRGFIYVCNRSPPCIHQLTKRGELLAIHVMPSAPMAISCDDKQKKLYVTNMKSKEVWIFCPQGSEQGQESSSTSGEKCPVLGQLRVLSDEEAVRLWAKENGINARALDELLEAGCTSIEALKLLELNDLKDTKIPVVQKRLIIKSVHRLTEKDVAQVQSIQMEHRGIFPMQYSQNGRQSRTPQQTTAWTKSIASINHQPHTVFSVGIEDPYTHTISDTRCADQMLSTDCASVRPTSALNTQGLENVGPLQSSLDNEMEILSQKDPQDNLQSAASGLPAEILRMDEKSKWLFKEALKKGEEKVYNIRVMVVGHGGVGKTTLIKRLLGKNVNLKERCATEGIDIYMHCCDVSVETFEWKLRQTEDRSVGHRLMSFFGLGRFKKHSPESEDSLIRRVAKVVNEETWKTKFSLQAKQENHPSRKHPDQTKRDGGIRSTVENQVTIIQEQNKSSESKQECPSTAGGEKHSKPAENKNNISEVRGNLDLDFKGDTLHSLLCEKAPKLSQSTDEYASLAVWDFAGQCAFYTTHQTFMTRRAIYLLVSDVSERFDNLVDDECYLDSRGRIQCYVRDLVEVWMNSIHSFSSSPEEGIPPVILVGTHVDRIRKADRHKVCERYFEEVRTYLKDKPSRFHLVNEEFAIDNTVVDSKLENLKKKIVQVASQQTYWGEKIPAQWLHLEQALMKLRHDGKKVIPRSVLEDLAVTHEIATDQLELFLRFQHDIGMILYFSIDILKEKIVLDTKWVIDALKSLINADDMEVMRNNPKLSSKLSDFKKYGILCPDLIDAIWTKEQYKEFHGNKEHVLLLMEQLNIIARPTSYVESNVKEENYFLAPCMLQQKTPEEIICPEPNDQMESSPIMCYVFVGNFLPSPIFHRLVAACIAHWPIAKMKTEMIEENLIFCGCCMFQLNEQHKLTLHFREHVIFLRVTRMGIKEKAPSSKLCIEVREFITTNLNNIIGYLGQSLKFEYFIQCPEYSGVSISSLIPVSRLKDNAEVRCDFHGHMIESCKVLDFWFEDQEQSGDSDASSVSPMPSQPSSDTDRFMCVTYLLVYIGARVLRQLLRHHTVTSTCTLDQYLAKYSNTINKLTKVFNKSLMAIMFPPNGSDTNLDDYDITLLSALFNNIVPSLSRQEKDLIQKLRDDRNKLFAHAKSCQINPSDFQTHWNDISSTLITLSQQCGDAAFEAKILQEIQRTQISAIPAGSYLDILKSWFDMIETVKDELQNVTSRLQALESKEQSSASEL